MVAHPGQILEPHSLLPLRQRRRLKADRGVDISLESERHLFLKPTSECPPLFAVQNTCREGSHLDAKHIKTRFDFKQIRI